MAVAQPQEASEYLKCGYCHRGTDFYILFNFNEFTLRFQNRHLIQLPENLSVFGAIWVNATESKYGWSVPNGNSGSTLRYECKTPTRFGKENAQERMWNIWLITALCMLKTCWNDNILDILGQVKCVVTNNLTCFCLLFKKKKKWLPENVKVHMGLVLHFFLNGQPAAHGSSMWVKGSDVGLSCSSDSILDCSPLKKKKFWEFLSWLSG